MHETPVGDPAAVALLRMDQCRRWRGGERLLVEAYVQQEPALRADPEAALELIYNEIVLREEMGDSPRLEEYLTRFPEHANQLRVQFEVHQFLEAPALTSGNLVSADDDTTAKTKMAETPLAPGGSLPGYEILGELGRGGMGVVYRARQIALHRIVALKVILAGVHAGPAERSSFRNEALAVARLQHPNIVQIFDVAEHDGLLYLALEFVDGPSLDKHVAATPCSDIEAAQTVETIARAMHYAHQQGIVHRDLKPSNILLVSGAMVRGDEPNRHHAPLTIYQPKVTDFGVAKLLDAEGSRTATGELVGTPHYMAPEQAGARGKEVRPAADVYSLGAILYHLLTGQPPFQGNTALEVLDQARAREPLPPSSVRAGIPADLETICLKCLAKEPALRYASGAELGDDLHRFLAGEPILARRAGWWERVWKWAKRHPAAAALTVLTMIVLPLLLLMGIWQRHEESGRFRAARARYEHFMAQHDEALFHGIYSTAFADTNVAENLEAARTRIREALGVVGLPLDAEAPPAADPCLSERENTDIVHGCYQLILVLADATMAATPELSTADQRRQIAAALQILERACAFRPPTKAYYLRYARYQRLLDKKENARQAETRADRQQAVTARDHFDLGYEHYRQGDLDQAIRDFSGALEAARDDFWSRFLLGVCYEKKLFLSGARSETLLADAKSTFDRCIAQRPQFPWSYLLRGSVYEKLNAAAEAERDYATALGLQAGGDIQYYLYANRGRMRFNLGRLEEAAGDLRQAIAARSGHHFAHLVLARVYQKQKQFDKSNLQLAEAIRCQPPAEYLAQCRLEQARNLYLDGQFAAAVMACAETDRVWPRQASTQLLRGRVLLQLKRYQEAMQSFEGYLMAGGRPSVDFFRGRGLARLHRGDHTGAVADFTRVVEMEPDAEIYRQRGWALYFADAWKAARGDFDEAIRRNAKDGEAHIGRGLARVMLGCHRQAVADAEIALARRPERAEMVHNVACIFALALAKVNADPKAEDRPTLAASYRTRAIASLRQALSLVAPAERPTFWRDKVLLDAALNSVRDCAEFKDLAGQQGLWR